MHKVEVPIIETTIQKTHTWLKEIVELMGWGNQQQAYHILRAVLHALRDRLPVEVAAKFGAQLPLLIRGIYYESWVPSHTPVKIHHTDEFFNLIEIYLGSELLAPHVNSLTQIVFKVVENHISEGEIENLKRILPKPIASFFTS